MSQQNGNHQLENDPPTRFPVPDVELVKQHLTIIGQSASIVQTEVVKALVPTALMTAQFNHLAELIMTMKTELKDEIGQLRNEVSEVRNTVNEVKGEVEKVKGEVEKVKGEVEKVKEEVGKVKEEVEKVKEDVGNINRRIQATEANSLARLQNGQAKYDDAALTPLRNPIDNSLIPHQPTSLKALLALQEAELQQLLELHGAEVPLAVGRQPRAGAVANEARLRKLRNKLAVTMGLREIAFSLD